MTSSVSFALLTVVIRCCVYGGVTNKHQGKCVEKGKTRALQEIFDDSRSMFTADSRLCSKGRKKVRCLTFFHLSFASE